MKSLIVAASALIIATSPAFAGGWGHHQQPTSPQFANASALNYAAQLGSVKAFFNKGSITQVTGAAAEAINKSNCGCKGSQTANAFAKNVSIQTATIKAGVSIGSISQTAVASSVAKNIR